MVFLWFSHFNYQRVSSSFRSTIGSRAGEAERWCLGKLRVGSWGHLDALFNAKKNGGRTGDAPMDWTPLYVSCSNLDDWLRWCFFGIPSQKHARHLKQSS